MAAEALLVFREGVAPMDLRSRERVSLLAAIIFQFF
jgi:hypothetical protein